MDKLQQLQQRVYQLFGYHSLNFQYFELKIKAVLKIIKLTSITNLDDTQSIKHINTNNQTLGGLNTNIFRFLFREHKDSTESSELYNPNFQKARIDFEFNYTMCHCNRNKLINHFDNFVQDRNYLIHHFLNDFPLNDETSCKAAIKFLSDLENKHSSFKKDLDFYLSETRNSIKKFFNEMDKPSGRVMMFFPFDEIYQEIEILLDNYQKKEGWIPLTTVISHIVSKYPSVNQKIKNEYGFKNINDLILNSGLFLLKIEPTSKGERILIKFNYEE